MNHCRMRMLASSLDAFVDGELSPEGMLEVEEHLRECRRCMQAVRFTRALKLATRQVVRAAATPAPGFERRVLAAFAAERMREAAVESGPGSSGRILPWSTILPMAAAAAIVLVWAASVQEPPQTKAAEPVRTSSSVSVLDELLNHHTTAEPEVLEPSLVQTFEPSVGVPVQVPSLVAFGARWEGGSVVPVRASDFRDGLSRQAALLRYRLGQHRVSVYIYDANRVPLARETGWLKPRVVGDIPVFVGSHRGYSIAATERRGVGYAAAADLDDAETAELVAASFGR